MDSCRGGENMGVKKACDLVRGLKEVLKEHQKLRENTCRYRLHELEKTHGFLPVKKVIVEGG